MSELNGTYSLVAKTPLGNQDMQLTVTVTGDTFTATSSGAMGASDISGTVEGNTLSWKQAITVPMPLTLDCSATIDGGNVTGTANTGAFGAFPITGTRNG